MLQALMSRQRRTNRLPQPKTSSSSPWWKSWLPSTSSSPMPPSPLLAVESPSRSRSPLPTETITTSPPTVARQPLVLPLTKSPQPLPAGPIIIEGTAWAGSRSMMIEGPLEQPIIIHPPLAQPMPVAPPPGSEKEEKASWKSAGRQKRGVKARGSDEEAREEERRLWELEARVRQAEASIRTRETAVGHKEDLANLKEMDIQRRETDVYDREEKVRLKEEEVARREGDVRKKEGQVKALEAEAQIREARALARRREKAARRLREKALQSLEEVARREASARRAEASAEMRKEPQLTLPETSHQHDKPCRRTSQHEAEPRTNRAKTDIQPVEEQRREKERYLQVGEAEVQTTLRTTGMMDERSEATTLQADASGLRPKSTTMKEWVENLRLREVALTQLMANEPERQGDHGSNDAASASGDSTIGKGL